MLPVCPSVSHACSVPTRQCHACAPGLPINATHMLPVCSLVPRMCCLSISAIRVLLVCPSVPHACSMPTQQCHVCALLSVGVICVPCLFINATHVLPVCPLVPHVCSVLTQQCHISASGLSVGATTRSVSVHHCHACGPSLSMSATRVLRRSVGPSVPYLCSLSISDLHAPSLSISAISVFSACPSMPCMHAVCPLVPHVCSMPTRQCHTLAPSQVGGTVVVHTRAACSGTAGMRM